MLDQIELAEEANQQLNEKLSSIKDEHFAELGRFKDQ